MRPHFRFEDLEIWQLARDLAVKLHRLAEELDRKRLYRYGEQLRSAGLSLTNNVAEGSGSLHSKEFVQFLNISRRSLFEDASMLLVFETLGLFESAEIDSLLSDCDKLSRKITSFSRTLRTCTTELLALCPLLFAHEHSRANARRLSRFRRHSSIQ